MKTNASVTPIDIVKKDAPPISETNKIISMLSEQNSDKNKKETELEPETTSQNSQEQKQIQTPVIKPEEVKNDENKNEENKISEEIPKIETQEKKEEKKNEIKINEDIKKEENQKNENENISQPKIEETPQPQQQQKTEEIKPQSPQQKIEETPLPQQQPKIEETPQPQPQIKIDETPQSPQPKAEETPQQQPQVQNNSEIEKNQINDNKDIPVENKTEEIKPIEATPSSTGIDSQMFVEEEQIQRKRMPQIKNNLSGIPDRDYIIKKIKEKKDDLFGLDYSAFDFSTVDEDRNSGYRALSLQIFGNEDNHNEIRKAIYTCCLNNKNKIAKYNFQKHRTILTGEEYLRIIKTNDELLGDFEVKTFSFLFNAEIFIFELKEDKRLYLISEHPKLDDIDKSKLVLTLCIMGGQWQVIYEKGRLKNYFCEKDDLVKTLEKNIKRQDHFELKFDYCRDNRKMKYVHLENFLQSKFIQPGGVYPDFINEITDERKKSYKKREFRELSKKYFLDDKTGRLKIIFNVSNRSKNKNYKEFFIPYLLEKFNIIREVHDELTHDERNTKTLDALVKEHDFWWYGVYQDIKNYGGHCPLCN